MNSTFHTHEIGQDTYTGLQVVTDSDSLDRRERNYKDVSLFDCYKRVITMAKEMVKIGKDKWRILNDN